MDIMTGLCILAVVGVIVVGCMSCIKVGAMADMELQYMFEGLKE